MGTDSVDVTGPGQREVRENRGPPPTEEGAHGGRRSTPDDEAAGTDIATREGARVSHGRASGETTGSSGCVSRGGSASPATLAVRQGQRRCDRTLPRLRGCGSGRCGSARAGRAEERRRVVRCAERRQAPERRTLARRRRGAGGDGRRESQRGGAALGQHGNPGIRCRRAMLVGDAERLRTRCGFRRSGDRRSALATGLARGAQLAREERHEDGEGNQRARHAGARCAPHLPPCRRPSPRVLHNWNG